MGEFKVAITKAIDEKVRIEFRSEESIRILKSIAWKNKPTKEDMDKVRQVIKLLEQ